MESNLRFYARRAAQEQQAANRSVTEAAKTWHQTLADHYAALARAPQETQAA